MALATDFNPGTCPILVHAHHRGAGLPAAAADAGRGGGGGHHQRGPRRGDRETRCGSLEPGKRGDLLILDAPSHLHLAYWFGRNLVRTVVIDGRVVVDR